MTSVAPSPGLGSGAHRQLLPASQRPARRWPRWIEFFRAEPLYHYAMDRFLLKSPLLYHPDHKVVHIGGGPHRNHPRETNINVLPLPGVDLAAAAERLPLASASVDVVISNAVLEHVRDLNTAVAEIDRVLKPGGLVYIEIPFLQHYHTHDIYGVRFEDYRRLTKVGLTEAFPFCTPVEVGVCVGPISAALQIAYSCLADLSGFRIYGRAVSLVYHVVGNVLCRLDGLLSEAALARSRVPSGVFFFGRKHDENSEELARLPRPNSAFPRGMRSEISLLAETPQQLRVRVHNRGPTTWLHQSPVAWGMVQLGVQRVRAGKTEIDFARIPLPHDLSPGESFDAVVDLEPLAGADQVRLDVVIEGVCWLADRGSRALVAPLK